MTNAEIAAASAMAMLSAYNYMLNVYYYKQNKKPRQKRRIWTKIHRNRTAQNMENKFTELLCEPLGEFENFCRMSSTDFEFLLCKIAPIISKQDTDWKKAIPAKVRLAVTLRFLESGDSYKSLHFQFKISKQIISRIIPEVCAAINEALKDEIKMPSTVEGWLATEEGFAMNFPHCLGVIDEKHIALQCLANSGSEYNHKQSFSLVLMALVDSNCCFMHADIGSQERITEGGEFRNTLLWQKICSNTINSPPACPLPQSNKNVPYVFLGDGAFALSKHVMKPYPGNHETSSPKCIFNKRLSSSRVVVENVFGIMTSVFRVFMKPIPLKTNTASLLTMSCILLHNFLRRSRTSGNLYTPPGTMDTYENGTLVRPGLWRQNQQISSAIRPMQHVPRKPTLHASQIREEFATYFYNNNT